MFYGAGVWDPWLIVAQIICFQCVYYLTLGFFLSILVGTTVSRMSLVYFFDYITLSTSTVTGKCVIASFLLTSLAGAGYLVLLIERAKICWDFSVTLFVIHLFACMVYGGFPSSVTWWVVNGIGIGVMALLGEYICIKRELREIPITRRPSSSHASPNCEAVMTETANTSTEGDMEKPAEGRGKRVKKVAQKYADYVVELSLSTAEKKELARIE